MRIPLVPAALLFLTQAFAQAPAPAPVFPVSPEDRATIEHKADELAAALQPLRGKVADDLIADAEIYEKAARYILRFNEFFSKDYAAHTIADLDAGLARAKELATGTSSWAKKTGTVSRAYRSRVDGSLQPYAVTVPADYDPAKPAWLEVELHGRGANLNEVSFLYSHDHAKPAKADYSFIKLEVFGRANVAYRWAGETDVFEAIDSVRKRYNIDPARIALRGFSMGGGGAWHLGLHFPDQWDVVEAGAGFVETKVHGNVKTEIPRYASIYDVLDVALNAVDTPWSGYGGEDDPQRRASIFIREALQSEGYHFTPDGLNNKGSDINAIFLIGPHTQHKWEPNSKATSDAFVLENEKRGIVVPDSLRFVTYTERYNRCYWVTVDQLDRQYARAQVDAKIEGRDLVATTRNIARLTLRNVKSASRFVIDGQAFPAKPEATFEKAGNSWKPAADWKGLNKRRGLQGPIDDAFMESFTCVRPMRGPSSSVGDYAVKQLDRFAAEYAQWLRGDIRIVDYGSGSITGNLVAFGTPETNPFVSSAVKESPIKWTAKEIVVGKQRFDAATHMLSMIYPDHGNPARYIVVNSGHTFHEADFKGTNVLLYPRVGDWAVTDITTGQVVAEGTFDRHWQLDAN